MEVENGVNLAPVLAVLGAAVVAVPLARVLGFGSIVAYLFAGVIVGPFGLRVVTEPAAILPIAELGVVLFLFIIGLEMQPRRLWSLRKQIFGVGVAQVAVCGAMLTAIGVWAAGLSPPVAFVGAMGFVLSSTAAVMQMLDEQGETATLRGQRIVSILLLEDLAIVPLLAAVAALAPAGSGSSTAGWVTLLLAVGALAGLVAASRWLLNPVFALLARLGAREVMTAAALLLVLGIAWLFDRMGLSMAMGAFGAGVMLSESVFRHQLEADIEPFRGLLLGLFFITVGMSLDVDLVIQDWKSLLGWVLVYMAGKALGVYLVARIQGDKAEALQRALLMAQGGEFAFVLYSAAMGEGLLDARTTALLTAAIILSMALTPVLFTLCKPLLERAARRPVNMDGIDPAKNLHGAVLIIGFGRFGQVASQALLARGIDITIIDRDTEMIRAAAGFGFKVYYGDGTRLDVLHASGAGESRAVMLCIDDKEATTRIVRLCRDEFPHATVFARAFDRPHSVQLRRLDVGYEIRETFESALALSLEVLRRAGVDENNIEEIGDDIRARDRARIELLLAGDRDGSRALMYQSGRMVPTPFTKPRQEGRALNAEAQQAVSGQDTDSGGDGTRKPTKPNA